MTLDSPHAFHSRAAGSFTFARAASLPDLAQPPRLRELRVSSPAARLMSPTARSGATTSMRPYICAGGVAQSPLPSPGLKRRTSADSLPAGTPPPVASGGFAAPRFDDLTSSELRKPTWLRTPPAARADPVDADSEVVYAFYPGTGQHDVLAHNVLNAPVPPLWREKKCVGSRARANSKSSKTGRFAVRRLVDHKLCAGLVRSSVVVDAPRVLTLSFSPLSFLSSAQPPCVACVRARPHFDLRRL